MPISAAPNPRYACPYAFRCRRSLATEPATCTKPRVRRRRRAGTCCAPPIVPRRRRVSIRVDVKTCASFVAEFPDGLLSVPTGPAGHLPASGEGSFEVAPGGRRGDRTPGLGWKGMGSDFFGHPQPRRACAGVGRHLRLRWADGTAGDDADGCPVAAGADWLLGWADAVF